MATIRASTQDLFVRNATGLVRSWASFDAFIYSFFSINLVTLGWYEFAFAPGTSAGGNLLTAIIISGILILAEVVVYAGLIAVMPRAGGDYVWQTRVLGGGLGFVLAITGWVFTLWLWVPIYGNILSVEVVSPLCTILASMTGSSQFVTWAESSQTSNGYMFSSVVVAVFAVIVIAAGMKVYARVQKTCFYGAIIGLVLMLVLFLASDHASFVSGFNSLSNKVFGTTGDVYTKTLTYSAKNGYTPTGFSSANFSASFTLIPLLLFFNLWPNWGATLYGEVRGANDFRRNLQAMASALIVTTLLAVLTLTVIAKVTTAEFYNAGNYAFATQLYGAATWPTAGAASPFPIWTYPGLLAASLTTSSFLQLVLIILMSLWFWGWCGTVFLSSTRVLFAAAFDRVLPEWAAAVSRGGVPINALIGMVVPAMIVSVLYCYNIWSFQTVTLDATLVIAVTFFGSTLVAILLPWRQKRIYDQSPIARYTVAGVPLITVAGVIFLLFLAWNLYQWFSNAIYGVNNHTSLWFILALYAIALAIYAGSRVLNSQRGVNLTAIHREIPVE